MENNIIQIFWLTSFMIELGHVRIDGWNICFCNYAAFIKKLLR